MFKVAFTRVIVDGIKKIFLIIMIIRVILMIEAVFFSTIKSK